MNATHRSPINQGYDALHDVPNDLPRQAKDDALDPVEFQLLLEGARDLDEYYAQQARFAVLLCGRLGLRRGELTHLRKSWIDWRRNMICIPRRQPCDKGRGGDGPCGDCKQKARQYVEHAPADEPLTYEQAIARRWEPKTSAAAREIPFDHDPRVQLEIERFFDRFDRWPVSYAVTGRRISAAAEAAGMDPSSVYPHCLRASAATYHANRGLRQTPLQALMGWADLSTAQSYIRSSGENTQRALNAIHAR